MKTDTNKSEEIRFAIVGCGRISDAHIKAIKAVPGAELAAVCDVMEERARMAASTFNLGTYYLNCLEMFEKEKIDVVNICTPSGMHGEIAIAAAEYGINVLCEKPLEITDAKMTRMIGKCKKSGVLLGCVFQRRMCSMARHAKKAIDDNKLGRIILADAALKYYRSQEYYNSDSWRGTWGLDGGGALMNQGIHGIDLLQWLAGGVQSVYAYCDTKVRSIEAEDTAVALLKFRSGAFGVIEGTTSVYPGNETVLSVYGDNGTISFGDNEFHAWNLAGSSDAPPDVTISMGGKNCSWEDDNIGHALIIEDMADAVRNNRQPYIPGEEARKAVDIILSIYESSRTGKEAFINDISCSG